MMSTFTNIKNDSSNYVEAHLPPEIVEKLQAGAFESLVSHLQERSDAVQNMDLMTVSGFCRNCLAKVIINMDSDTKNEFHASYTLPALYSVSYA